MLMKLFLFGDIYDSQPRVKRFPVFIMEMNATCFWGFFQHDLSLSARALMLCCLYPKDVFTHTGMVILTHFM